MLPDLVPIRRALISVSDKTGLSSSPPRSLRARGRAGLDRRHGAGAARGRAAGARRQRALTDFPEMLDGRVKTLHPMVHGGLLARARRSRRTRRRWTSTASRPIDLVVVNLYPFEATVAAGADFAACIENIDIGGPAMLRSAAKNHGFVTVVTDVEDYPAAPRRARAAPAARPRSASAGRRR